MAQDAAVPMTTIRELARKIAQEEVAKFARSGFLRNASITGGNGLTIRGEGGITVDGGRFRVIGIGGQSGATGDATVYMGGITPTLPDGSLQPGLIIRRNDGTIALALYDPTPDPGGPDAYEQFLAWFDRAQQIVVSDDTDSGSGLARPYVPIPVTRARYTDMPAVTDAGFVDVYETPAGWHKVNARARVDVRCTTDTSGTAGEVRVLVDGVQVGTTQPVGFVVETKSVGPFAVPGNAYTSHRLTVQARRTAGTGAVRLAAAVWGVQS